MANRAVRDILHVDEHDNPAVPGRSLAHIITQDRISCSLTASVGRVGTSVHSIGLSSRSETLPQAVP
ncbi:hypothetical protein L873DRAFT_1804841 [Choiromyces venosus 120613-1]|uniref:Uncharacterized protein n=1 Tax=Choiromyces venosus 120613-1 TaxID=1336337 RepID=A0A3N4JQX3_9PEZI|nr:hypothetical protein L873DRAFT_1804841 [Choiromyces venosus 120613-1]